MRKNYKAEVSIEASAYEALLLDVYKRKRIEACGLLLGTMDDAGNWHVDEIHPMRNIFDSPVYFEFAPEDLLEVELHHPDRVIGVYHSHPTGFPRASSTDKENMRRVNVEQEIPWAWLIISGPFAEPSTPPTLAPERLVAYHHYADAGLQHISIQLARQSDGMRDSFQQASHQEGHRL